VQHLKLFKILSYPWLIFVSVVFLTFIALGFTQPLNEYITLSLIISLTANTLLLCILVAVFTSLIAIPCSIFVTMFDFYGRKFFSWALCLSLAFPIYVYAFIFVGAAEEVSFISITIRENIILSALILSLGLYPYTFLLCKAQLRKIGINIFKASKSLGKNNLQTIYLILLPSLKPSIIAGTVLCIFETISDFGGVATLGINTLTVGIFNIWFGYQDLISGAKISLMLFFLALIILYISKLSPENTKFSGSGKENHNFIRTNKALNLSIALFCSSVFFITFIFPFAQLIAWSSQNIKSNIPLELILNSFLIGFIVAFAASIIAIILSLGSFKSSGRIMFDLSTIGYSIPGSVLAISLLFVFNYYLGLSITIFGIWGLFLCLLIRFITPLIRYLDAALTNMTEGTLSATRIFSKSLFKTFKNIYFPALYPSLLLGFLVVFIEVIKEQPATLLLRPVGFDTLSSKIYNFTSEGQWELAAPPSLALIALSLILVYILNNRIDNE
tara:strand:- start:6248 stop:7750 length:1503 start_codon:yes stop_codon:yes gene_type:complete